MSDDDLRLFALNASRAFGTAVSARLGIPLSRARGARIRGRRAQGTAARERARLRRLRHPLALRRSGAERERQAGPAAVLHRRAEGCGRARVTAVVPVSRVRAQGSPTKARDPVSTRYVASLFEAVGTDCVVTLDVHNLAAFQNAFRCRTEHLEANGLFVAHFAPAAAGGRTSPSCRRTRVESSAPSSSGPPRRGVGRPVGAAFAEKYRSGGVVSGEALVGDVDGKVAIIVDDLISAGSTIARAAQACRDHGATRVLAAASHGLFAGAANSVLAAAARRADRGDRPVPPLARDRRRSPGQAGRSQHREPLRRSDREDPFRRIDRRPAGRLTCGARVPMPRRAATCAMCEAAGKVAGDVDDRQHGTPRGRIR